MEWDDLRTFLAVARAGTLSGAARALGTTQPTMGRRLAALEQRAGARLLERRRDGFVLTALGEAVLGNAERAEAEVIAAERLVSGHDIALEGLVRITTVGVLATRIITPAIAALNLTHPGIRVELVSDTRSLSLSRREADIAIRMARFEGAEIVTRKLGELVFGFFAARSYLDRRAALPRTSPEPPHQIVTVMDDQYHLPEVRWHHSHFPHGRVALASNSREIQAAACRDGLGVACLGVSRAREEANLVELPPSERFTREMWLGFHRDLRHMPRVRVVTEALVRAFRAAAARLTPDEATDGHPDLTEQTGQEGFRNRD